MSINTNPEALSILEKIKLFNNFSNPSPIISSNPSRIGTSPVLAKHPPIISSNPKKPSRFVAVAPPPIPIQQQTYLQRLENLGINLATYCSQTQSRTPKLSKNCQDVALTMQTGLPSITEEIKFKKVITKLSQSNFQQQKDYLLLIRSKFSTLVDQNNLKDLNKFVTSNIDENTINNLKDSEIQTIIRDLNTFYKVKDMDKFKTIFRLMMVLKNNMIPNLHDIYKKLVTELIIKIVNNDTNIMVENIQFGGVFSSSPYIIMILTYSIFNIIR